MPYHSYNGTLDHGWIVRRNFENAIVFYYSQLAHILLYSDMPNIYRGTHALSNGTIRRLQNIGVLSISRDGKFGKWGGLRYSLTGEALKFFNEIDPQELDKVNAICYDSHF